MTVVNLLNPSGLLAFGLPGSTEWIILLVLGLLIFGRRLPEVGRSLGRGIVEFKKGIKGIEDDIEMESNGPALPGEAKKQQIGQASVGGEAPNPYAPAERTESSGQG